jgi:CheY-like chemotaxis protein
MSGEARILVVDDVPTNVRLLVAELAPAATSSSPPISERPAPASSLSLQSLKSSRSLPVTKIAGQRHLPWTLDAPGPA